MADTLESLAGARFRADDVIAALQQPLPPEQIVLDRYVFMPHARTGIAAALTTPFDWNLPSRAAVELKVPVVDERGSVDAEMRVRVYGPADVLEVDPRQVIRAFPKDDAVDAEVDDLVHVEFDRPDLPWLFTPAGPDEQGRLVPWLTLVVAQKRLVEFGEQRGSVRVARIRRDQLQPLHDAWAWAHAQVTGAKAADAETEPTLERRLGEANAAHNLSRLVCPRRLDDNTAYTACVVPTFLAGAQAALGLTPVTTLAPAWGTAADSNAGDPLDMVTLPVYYSWSFATAQDGNFESLARKLRPRVAPPGVGRRRVDTTHPWPELQLTAESQGAEMVVAGPVVSPQKPESVPEEEWPTEADQQWPGDVTDTLVSTLNRPERLAHAEDPGPPLVGPPLYGAMHARQPRIEMAEPQLSSQPQWFRELNTDPRNRIVGGLGTRVVQAEQEDLIAAAWNQITGIEAANRALRLAQLAKHVTASLHRRHLSRFTDAAVLATTERVHGKVLDSPGRSVWAVLGASSLPHAVTAGAFRRLSRVRGPIVKTAVREAALRRARVDALTVLPDRFTRNWVAKYVAPDGIRALSAAARARLTAGLAQAVDPQVDRDTLLARWQESFTQPTPSELLTPESLDQIPQDPVPLGRHIIESLGARLVRTAPDDTEMEHSADAAANGLAFATMLGEIVAGADIVGLLQFPVARADAERLQLEPLGPARESDQVFVSPVALRDYAARAREWAVRWEATALDEEFAQTATRLTGMIGDSIDVGGGRISAALRAIATSVVIDDRFTAPARGRINAPALELVRKLDPARTIPARVSARLHLGSGRFPNWLRPDWFDDLLVEPVMAHPRFTYPMYEPLHRYDREWMVPGLGLIESPDMATLLLTNNRFIEAYLIGLNHEMARELLWREFPTDQRGTYFDSFWTGAKELVADLHETAWHSGGLRSHVDPHLDGQLVFLVRGDLIRRYPGVVAHAAREAARDRGIPVFEADSPIKTLFHVHLPPNLLLVGFAMPRERIDTPGEKWWFTLSENPTEPRFGLDPSRDGPITRDNLVWTDLGVNRPGGFLDATTHTDIAFDNCRWGASSAQTAYLLFQLPARAAFLAKKMVAGAVL
ncbi:hypothetical protein ACWEQA_08895 [Nocardia sp. NPDC004085]